MIIKIEINNCNDCPHLLKGMPQTTDGFDEGRDWFCKNKENKKIAGFVEWHEEKKLKVPEWCPCV